MLGGLPGAGAYQERHQSWIYCIPSSTVQSIKRGSFLDTLQAIIHRSFNQTGMKGRALTTTQLPQARAGPNFQANMSRGKFHGMICPATPAQSPTSGSFSTRWPFVYPVQMTCEPSFGGCTNSIKESEVSLTNCAQHVGGNFGYVYCDCESNARIHLHTHVLV